MVFIYICDKADYKKAHETIANIKKSTNVKTWNIMKSGDKNRKILSKAIAIYIIPPVTFSDTNPTVDFIDCKSIPTYIVYNGIHKVSRLTKITDKIMLVSYV